jgi:hypothetical protein
MDESDETLASPVTVQYTVDITSTATATTDYQTLSGSVTFAANSAYAVIPVTPVEAHLCGGSKIVSITLSSSSNYLVNSDYASAMVTILDNDPPTVSITANTAPPCCTHRKRGSS